MIDRKAKTYSVICPTCKKKRFVVYSQWWNIFRKKSYSGNCYKCKKGTNTDGLSLGWGWNKGLPKKQQPRYGNKVSDATKEKLRIANTGRKMTEQAKEKMRNKKLGKCGILSNRWDGGKSFEPYSTDWTETLRRSIRERDGYVCAECGKPQGDIAHDVHHIDYNKQNCNPDNLITLCKSCHMKTNKKTRL